MIRAYAEKKGTRCRLYVEGHANADGGNDAVCAAVSALVGALLEYAERCGNCRHLRTSLARGMAFLSCHGGLGAAFDMVLLGLAEIGRCYPEHLKLDTALMS